jgi:hypothetical protein
MLLLLLYKNESKYIKRPRKGTKKSARNRSIIIKRRDVAAAAAAAVTHKTRLTSLIKLFLSLSYSEQHKRH